MDVSAGRSNMKAADFGQGGARVRRLFFLAVAVAATIICTPVSAIELRELAVAFGPDWSASTESRDDRLTLECLTEACGGPGLAALFEMAMPAEQIGQMIDDPHRQLQGFKLGFERSLKSGNCTFLSYRVSDADERRVSILADGECVGLSAALAVVFERNSARSVAAMVVSSDMKRAVAARERFRKALYRDPTR